MGVFVLSSIYSIVFARAFLVLYVMVLLLEKKAEKERGGISYSFYIGRN